MPIQKTIEEVRKKYGNDSIFLGGEKNIDVFPVISTGSFALDLALGIGGIPRGRITEIYGPEGAGKTTICQHVIGNCQRMGGVAAFIDVEHAQDPGWLYKCGVDINKLYIIQPDCGEQALDITESLVRSGDVDLIVLDSVAGLVPRAEIEGDMGDAHVGLIARLMSQAMRKLAGPTKQNKTALVFTNQIRQKIGVTFGNPETTPGGLALKFYSSIRIDVRQAETLKDKTEAYGIKVKATVRKNKMAPCYRQCFLEILSDEAISHTNDIIDFASDIGVINKKGAGWYDYGEIKLGQGKPNVKEFLENNQEVLLEIENKVREKLGFPLIIKEGYKNETLS